MYKQKNGYHQQGSNIRLLFEIIKYNLKLLSVNTLKTNFMVIYIIILQIKHCCYSRKIMLLILEKSLMPKYNDPPCLLTELDTEPVRNMP
jgi:hypothetical protein